jgi:AcrR family transcriptional regulator
MPGRAEHTRRRIVDAAYDVFYKEGFAHAGLDAVARAAGVTKRTLYHHFDSKQTLIAAVLEAQHGLALARIRQWGERAGDDPEAVVVTMFAEYQAWSRRAGWRSAGFTRAAMEFARSPGHPARIAARRHKAAVEDWLAEQFARGGISEARELARRIMLLVEGCNALILMRGDASYAVSAGATAQLLVRAALGRSG